MNLEQLLAALRAGGDEAADAIRNSSPELRTQAITALTGRIAELRDAETTEDNVAALEAAVSSRRALADADRAATELAARQEAARTDADAFNAANGNPGSDAEHDLPEGSAGAPPMPGDESTSYPHGGLPPGRSTNRDGTTDPDPAPAGGTGTGTTSAQRGTIAAFAEGQAGTGVERVVERQTAGEVRYTAHATGNLPGLEAGQTLDEGLFERAFLERAEAIYTPRGGGAQGRYHVVRFDVEYPEARTLGESAQTNDTLIAAATDYRQDESLVAAGGLCAPLEPVYDIPVIGVTDTPVGDQAMTSFRTPRGGVQYRTPMDALAMDEGLGIWTMEDDAAVIESGTLGGPIPEPYKSCFVVDCPGTLEAFLYSTYMCIEFPNITARFDPEWVRATTRASLVTWSRYTENQRMARMFTASRLVLGKQMLSAARDILANYDKVISEYRNRHRLNRAVALHAVFPQWIIELLSTDVSRQMMTSDIDAAFSITESRIRAWFASRNVNVTFHLDGLDSTVVAGHTIPDQHYGNANRAPGATVNRWPTEVDTLLYTEGDWLKLDGGTLDLGLVRDSRLNARNRYQTFVETFEGVAFNGVESMRVVMPLEPTGAMAGTVAISAIED
jgi:hypothetical protein